jgi:hypothetical protein
LVLDSVTSTPQWIRQPKPRDVLHDVCVLVCECVNMCSEVLGLLSPWISGYAFSSTLAFSLRLMPFRLAVGATTSSPGPSAPPPPSSPPPNRFILFTCPLHLGLHYARLTWRLKLTTNLTNLTKPKKIIDKQNTPDFHAPH